MSTSKDHANPEITLSGNNRLTAGRSGVFLYNRHDIYVGRSLAAYGEFSGEEAEFLEDLVNPGDIVIEVGKRRTSALADFRRAVKESGKDVLLLVRRGNFAHYVVVTKR